MDDKKIFGIPENLFKNSSISAVKSIGNALEQIQNHILNVSELSSKNEDGLKKADQKIDSLSKEAKAHSEKLVSNTAASIHSKIDSNVSGLSSQLSELKTSSTESSSSIKNELEDLKRVVASKKVIAVRPEAPAESLSLRLENSHGIPESSGLAVGRILLNTIDENIYCDMGYKFKRVSNNKFAYNVTVSDPKEPIKLDLEMLGSDIDDARNAIWQVCENLNDFQRVKCDIRTPDAKHVVIVLNELAQIGAYRILGVE